MNHTRTTFGFGVHKLPPRGASREERLERSRQMLARVLNLHTAIAFVGSGCSVPLNYPSWQRLCLKVVEHTLRNITDTPFATRERIERLERFQRQLRSDSKVASDQLLFMLGVCQQLFQEKDPKEGKSKFRLLVAGEFGGKDTANVKHNPYHALMDLQIQRFVTSNYDFEIEKALAWKRQVDPIHLRLREPEIKSSPESLRSFTQQPEHFDHLALFVLSRVDAAKDMVFHCHGSYRDPESMVITEADYQAWYFSGQDDAGAGFRQNLHLLLGSNPILFVGFGLSDDDLIRPLRMFAAEDLKGKSSRPLFALMPQIASAPEEEQKRNEDYFDQLYDRYGVHVIPFELAETKDGSSDEEKSLYGALKQLNDYRLDIRDEWLRKPLIRKVDVTVHPTTPYHHYPLTPNENSDFEGPRVKALLNELRRQAADPAVRVIGLIGPGGTGKSWLAQELMELTSKTVEGIQGRFFWSSYYSNDALTGLDRALAYLETGDPGPGDRVDRFAHCLTNGKHLLVFDGIERFLQETDKPMIGKGYTPLTEKLFKAMCSAGESTIIITSRLWPESFGPMDAKTGPARCTLIPHFRSEDILEFAPFSWARDEVPELVSLLDGHVHALVLAAQALRKAGADGARKKLRDIKRKLSGTPPDRRGDRMIRMVIRSLDEESDGLASKLLERLSVFMSPVAGSTVSICLAQACEDADKTCGDKDTLVKKLADSRLLHRIDPKPGESQSFYTVHPIVREYIFHRIHKAPVGSLPNFSLPGFTAVTSAFHPGSKESVAMLKKLLTALCETAEQRLDDGNRAEATALCRSAFSVVRSRMEALTAPRWCSYDEYLRILITVSHLARKVAGGLWSFAERRSIGKVESTDGPLYADELAWLYNELGLACYGEGAMPDTLAIWEQGLEINRAIDSREEGGSYLFQSLCNLGAAHIHYGRLDDAENYLREAERTNYRLKDKDHGGRITGYMALVKHLRGNLPQADSLYDTALKKLDKRKKWNPRAKSIFSRHRADLKIKLGDVDGARACIELSRGLAEEGNFPELAAAARMSLGHWFRSRGDFNAATREYSFALREAKRIGMRRLECEVISEFARLALDLGDSHIARQRAVESLRIANELVLGLKQTHDLVVLGCATIEARQHKLGIAYLKHAKRLADRQGYWLRSHEAEEQLHRFGESASDVEA